MTHIFKKLIPSIIFSLNIAYASDITDEYTDGDTLTAEKLNNIKAAVNSKQNRVEGSCQEGKAIAKVHKDGTVECRSVVTKNAETLGNIPATNFVQVGTLDGYVKTEMLNGYLKANALDNYVKSNQTCETGLVSAIDESGALICSSVASDNAKQNRVSGTCTNGSAITTIDVDGKVTCTTPASDKIDATTLGGVGSDGYAKSDQICTSGRLIGIDSTGKIICSEDVHFSIINTSEVELPNATRHVLTFSASSTIVNNEGNAFDPTSGIFTAPVEGTYTFNAAIQFLNRGSVANGDGTYMEINAGGIGYQGSIKKIGGITETQNISLTVHLGEGEKVYVIAYADTTASTSIGGEAGAIANTYFNGARVY